MLNREVAAQVLIPLDIARISCLANCKGDEEGPCILFASLLFLLSSCAEQPDAIDINGDSGLGFHPSIVALELNQNRVRPGGSFLCTLRFSNSGDALTENDYRVFLHIESPQSDCQGIAFQEDHEPAPPTSWWRPGEMIDLGARVIEVPPNQAEGDYILHAGLFDLDGEQRVLDSIPVTIVVDHGAPLLEDWVRPTLSKAHAAERRAALANRLVDQRTLETKHWKFSVGVNLAAFQLEDRHTGVLWSSNPLHDRLGLVHLHHKGHQKTITRPIDHIDLVSLDAEAMQITSGIGVPGSDAKVTLDLLVTPIDEGTGVSLSWQASGETEWTVDSVTLLDQAFSTTDADLGSLVLPLWLGELRTMDKLLPEKRRYFSHDISMQMAGLVKDGSALLFSWTDHYAALTSHAAIHDHPLIAGKSVRSVSLKLHAESPVVEIFPIGAGNYVDIARAYRPLAQRRGHHVTMARKRESDERVALLQGAPVFRLECLVCIPSEDSANESDNEAECLHTFEGVSSCAEHWREELGIDRALVLLGGWNFLGYDSGHPTILPANDESGGNKGLAECSRRVRALGYLLGLHDNYQDIYADSPSWNADLIAVAEDGEPRAGGLWAGGQSWMICTSLALAIAKDNLPRVAELFAPDFYFLDTTLTTRLQTCAHPGHLMSPLEDREHRTALFRYTMDIFGLLGLEGAREWAVPDAHFFEGILTHRTHERESSAIPVFPIVYGDCLNLLTLQADRLDPWDAGVFLDHLLYGEMPMYTVGKGLYWMEGESAHDLSEAESRKPEFVFARADRGWARDLGATDRLIKNTWEVLSYLHRAIGDSPMTDHRYLKDDRSAETTSFGDVRVTVNFSDEMLNVDGAILGRHGFVVQSPRFLAFHALRIGGINYPRGACFTLRSLDGEPLLQSQRIRVFHAFGEGAVRLPSEILVVEREAIWER
ncbi:MAG TPA: hypothetical protein EYF98_01280 [Planctomycetes bacterium]|nr:hypothetical protein [Planctomycetota bacterium]